MESKTLEGRSGCALKLLEVNGMPIVRKISGSILYNERLSAQYEKQKKYKSNIFFTPEVTNSGYEQGLFFFDMHYIDGVRLADHTNPTHFVKFFTSIIPNDWVEKASYEELKYKVIDLGTRVKGVDRAMNILKDTDWSGMPGPSSCHGDLTFENIIIKEGQLYLIDFLDSFYESWMIDLAKLFQDLELRWSYRFTTIDETLNQQLLLMKQSMRNHIRNHERRQIIEYLLYRLLLLNVVRIIPYAKAQDALFIQQSLDYLCERSIHAY